MPGIGKRIPGRFACVSAGMRVISAFCLFCASIPSRAQPVAITGCVGSPNLAGYECNKAYDQNSGSEWRTANTPGITQTLRLNLGQVRRIKKITVTWGTPPSGLRDYFYMNKLGYQIWLKTVTGSQTTDNITLLWGGNGGEIDTVPDTDALVIAVSGGYSSIKEVALHGPGQYTEAKLLTKVVPIPSWNMNLENQKCIDFPIGVLPARIVGMSAVIRSDASTVHYLAKSKNAQLYVGGILEDQGATGAGGNVSIQYGACSSGNQWKILVELAALSTFKSHSKFSNPATNPRGHVTLEYLSADPEYP